MALLLKNKNNEMSLVYLAFGSNIGNKTAFIRNAISKLQKNQVICLRLSQQYKSRPLLPSRMSDYFEARRNLMLSMSFVNCVGLFYTNLSPFSLLNLIKKIEKSIGKKKLGYWLPRVIDIDIIMYKNIRFLRIKTKTLHIPHLEFKKRSFVMRPIMQILS